MPRAKSPLDLRRVEISIGKKQLTQLEAYRTKTGCPMNEAIRRAIDMFFTANPVEIKEETKNE